MKFTKMHGLGNDFIIIEDLDCRLNNLHEIARRLCDRHTGIGADGILVVQKSECCDIKMRIINSDGSEANMCGNGIRCFAKYVYDKGISAKKLINIETLAGVMIAELTRNEENELLVKVDMGAPAFDKSLIPFVGEEDNISYNIIIDDRNYKAATILLGVPHTIVYVDKIDDEEIIRVGRKIETLKYFPERTNVNFVKLIDKDHLEVKTWERGAGLTLACGTGTCASVVASNLNQLTSNIVTVKLALGELMISYDKEKVFMEGPAEYICEGETLTNL